MIKFCSDCGQPVSLKIPPDDSRERAICTNCGTIHYENPRNVVGTIPVWQDQVLLCRRAIEPRKNYWTLPAGFLELGESTSAGAARETEEEAGAQVKMGALFSVINVIHVGQVHMFYLAQMTSPKFEAGIESLEVALFNEDEIPWDDLAFPTVKKTLKWFFEDRANGLFDKDPLFLAHHHDFEPIHSK